MTLTGALGLMAMFLVDLGGGRRQHRFQGFNKVTSIGGQADAIAIVRQPRLAVLPRQQLLAVVGEGLGTVDADVATAQVAAEVAENAHLEMAPVGWVAMPVRAEHQLAPALRGEGQVHVVGDPFGLAVLVVQNNLQGLQQASILRRRLKLQRVGHAKHRGSPAAERLPQQWQVVAAAPHPDRFAIGPKLIQACVGREQVAHSLPGAGVIQILSQNLENLFQGRHEIFAQLALARLDYLQLVAGTFVHSTDAAYEHLRDVVTRSNAHLPNQGQDQRITLGWAQVLHVAGIQHRCHFRQVLGVSSFSVQ